MSKREFLAKLEEALIENVDMAQAAQHIKYYREYIDSEVAKGRSEEDVVASLQSPRLIAKNIINNSESACKYDNNVKDYYSSEQSYTHNNYNNENNYNADRTFGGFTFSINGKPVNSFVVKLIAILALIVVVVLVLAVVSGIIWLIFRFILPVVFVIAIVSFIIKIFTSNNR